MSDDCAKMEHLAQCVIGRWNFKTGGQQVQGCRRGAATLINGIANVT